MKVKDPEFVFERVEKYLKDNIYPSRYRQTLDIPQWRYHESTSDDMINDAWKRDYPDENWDVFTIPQSWGGYDKVAWFRSEIEIPASWRGRDLLIRLVPGPRDGGESTAEGLLYVNEKAVQAVDIWHEEVILDEKLRTENKLFLALKVWSGVLGVPEKRRFKTAQLVHFDRRVERFCFLAKNLLDCAKILPDGDLKKISLREILNRAFGKINFLNLYDENYYKSVYEALNYLENERKRLAEYHELKPHVYGLGHSHIDMAWLWRLNATREKASRTFSTVLNLMKQYPEYKFMHSSPQLYAFLKEDHPDVFASVKEQILNGRWEITGGMWVESDTNLPSGESLVRQFLYGKRYIKEEFGRDSKLLWLPDVFGYSGALPQIMAKSGIKYFMTTKISWNQYNQFPYDTFFWEGIDGSKIFTHFITTPEDGSWFYTYNGKMSARDVTGVWENYKNKEINSDLLIAYGWGDGGGGPTREMLESMRVMENVPGIPYVKTSGAEDYFSHIFDKTDHEKMPVWKGELYFEYHRGTYTSQGRTKRANRKAEILLHNIEFLAAFNRFLGRTKDYPKKTLDKLWQRVLLLQFHDILPGSSIAQVYEDAAEDYRKIKAKGMALLEHELEQTDKTQAGEEKLLRVVNASGMTRSDYLELPFSENITEHTMLQYQEEQIPAQKTKNGLLFRLKDIPPYGTKTYRIVQAKPAAETKSLFNVTADQIDTPFYKIILNQAGEIEYLKDKTEGRILTCGKPLNHFVAYEDKPLRFDAWDIDKFYLEKPYPPFELQQSEPIETGPERLVWRQTWQFNRSKLTQDMILYAGTPRIDFVTKVDWHEHQVLLKVYFPFDIHCSEATFDIQFGTIKRPNHRNTHQDMARFEVCGHRFADLSEGDYGAAVLSDSKYGWDVYGGCLGLSLIKSAIAPDKNADQGLHEFTYSLYPHPGTFEESDTFTEALNINMPFLYSFVDGQAEETAAYDKSFVKTDCPHVYIDTVKQAEDGTGFVVRLYEFKNRKNTAVKLQFAAEVRRAWLCDLMENKTEEINLSKNEIVFPISPFEIVTVKVLF